MCKTIILYFLEIHQVKSNRYGSAPQHELQENNFFFFQRVNFISVLLYFILLSFNLKWCPENSPLVNFPPGEIRPIKFFPVNYSPVNYHVAKFPGLGLGLGNLSRWEFTEGQFTRGEFCQVVIHQGVTDRGDLIGRIHYKK